MEAQGQALGPVQPPLTSPLSAPPTDMDADPPAKHVRWPDEEPSTAPKVPSDRMLAKTLSDKLSQVAEQEGDRGVVSHPKQLKDVLQQLSLSHGNDAITREEVQDCGGFVVMTNINRLCCMLFRTSLQHVPHHAALASHPIHHHDCSWALAWPSWALCWKSRSSTPSWTSST